MAYIVGSASVEIVPDFKNAQLAITKFFNSQQNELRVPVKLDVKGTDSKNIEREAEAAGSRISEAMARGAAKNDAAATRAAERMARERERVLNFAHGEALRIQAQMDRDAARERELTEKVALASINQAHAEALRMQTAMDRDAARAKQASLRETMRAVQQQAAEEKRIAQEAERERERIIKAEQAFAVRSARESMRTAQQLAAARAKAESDAAREAARARQQSFRDEERDFQASLRSQIAAMKAAMRTASSEEKIRLQVEIDERNAILEGRRTGGLITRSIQAEMHQNAGLISAVIAGALIAGAPLAQAAAVTLFAGIGAAAAFQNERLRASWVGMWSEIKSGAVADAAVLVPVFDRMATSIGASFQRMRPQLRDAFAEVGPQIDSLTASVIQASENALPGLVRAVASGTPVIHGFGAMIESVGTGTGAFFDRISAHAPAAGSAMDELGESFEVLLPLFGELLGQGAELSAAVLPAVTGTLRGLLATVDALGASLPAIGAGFLAFRLVQGTGRLLTGWSQSLAMAAMNGGTFSGAMNRAAGALSSIGKAAPAVGLAIGLYGAAMADSEQRTQAWAASLNEGGEAARRARNEMEQQSAFLDSTLGSLATNTAGWTGLGAAVGIYTDDIDNAEQAHKDFLASLTPLEAAQRQTDIATRALEQTMGDESSTAADLAGAKADVARAAANQAAEEDKLARATRGVTEAMMEQADAARSRVDSQFAYEEAVLDVADAQEKYQDVLADTESSANDIAKALLDLNQAYAEQVDLAGEVAMSNLPAAMDDNQRAILGAKAELDELNKLMAQGVVLPPGLEDYRQTLINVTGEADGAILAQAQLTASLAEVGVAASAIPDSKAVLITSPTAPEVLDKLREIGFTVTTMEDGQVKVEAETQEAKDNLGNLSTILAELGITVTEPVVGINDGPFQTTKDAILAALGLVGSTNPTPTVTTIDQSTGIIGTILGSLGTVGRQNPRPAVTTVDQSSGTLSFIQRLIDGIQSKTVTLTTVHAEVFAGATTAGSAKTKADGGAAEYAIGGAARYDIGGQSRYKFSGHTYGRGGPRDDLIPAWLSPGEHVFDAQDVGLMGGQSAVYAFREMLNSGQFRQPAADTGVRQMVMAGMSTPRSSSAPQGGVRDVTILTRDNPRAILRAIAEDQKQQEALAPVWN